jgi:SAM-dependent methyltransferase
MRTDSQTYSDYLNAKYLPGRRLYLRWFFYPKLLRRFPTNETILDLGCGTGEFLAYCRRMKHEVVGVDSNQAFAAKCQTEGFKVLVDDICQLGSLGSSQFRYVICDNVLEHLGETQLEAFFKRLQALLVPGGLFICIVPGRRGFECDPTHRTFVRRDLLLTLLTGLPLTLRSKFYHPINLEGVDRWFYLNMQVFEIVRSV